MDAQSPTYIFCRKAAVVKSLLKYLALGFWLIGDHFLGLLCKKNVIELIVGTNSSINFLKV